MDGLTKTQIHRQEFVDNAILDLLNEVNPSGKKIEYEPRMIFEIREVVREWLVEKLACSVDMDFYPFVEEEKN